MTKQAFRKIIICCTCFTFCLCLMLGINDFLPPALADEQNASEQTTTSANNLTKAQIVELVNRFDRTNDSREQLMASCFDTPLEDKLPDSFEQECLSRNAFSSVSVSGEVIGCVFDGSCDATQAHCEEALAHKGWNELSGSNEYASNFYKASGSYHQLVLQYFPTAEQTLVVITIAERDQSSYEQPRP